ncbi:MAG: bile acid:sodium symporter family protein [Prevotellaceae bacterium]|jgi:BASS family bile acid:Na+ symporter|nr:bile acid:sodium symporter family protein [Prevotellaceae bacterium]
MNTIKKSLLLLPLFFLFGGKAEAQTIANKLKLVSIGADSTALIHSVGEPTRKESVVRWFYGKDQVVFAQGKIIDIRLHERSRKISLKKEKVSGNEIVSPISHLRIGMTEQEISTLEEELSLSFTPDLSVTGTDWYFTKRHRVELTDGKVEKVDLHIKANLEKLDWIRLNFSNGSLLFMYITIAFVMFGVALGIKLKDFRDLAKRPKLVFIGWSSQFILLPLLTFILVLIIRPTPSIAMGMILVAACPGGNVSNFMSSLAKGNVALSVSLTAIATISAIIMTPFNFWLWGSLYSKASELAIWVSIDIWEMLRTVFILLGIPIVLGIWFTKQFPVLTQKIKKPISWMSIFIFIGYIAAALMQNINYFLMYIHLIFLIVLIHNAMALFTGYGFSKMCRLSNDNVRTITVETGIQNSALGLVLIFNPALFNGLGGMAFIAAWWGIWHIIAGLTIAFFWSRREPLGMLK